MLSARAVALQGIGFTPRLVAVQGFPADVVSVSLDLIAPCVGPEFFYPR